MLREQVRDGRLYNPWERVFPGNALRIGRRGFNKLGYHENLAHNRKNSETTTEGMIQRLIQREIAGSQLIKTVKSELATPPNVEKQLSRYSSVSTDGQASKASVNFGVRSESRSTEHSGAVSAVFTASTSSTLKTLQSGSTSLSSTLTTGALAGSMSLPPVDVISVPVELTDVRMIYQISFFGDTSLEMLKTFVDVMVATFTFEELCDMEVRLKKKQINFLSPACLYFLQQSDLLAKSSFNLGYLLPIPEESFFRPDRPVGKLLYSTKTLTYVDEDEALSQVLRRSLKGMICYEVTDSPLALMISSTRIFPALQAQGYAWTRLRLVRGDGSIGIFLSKLHARNDEFVVITIQDHSEFFQNFLQSPSFA